MTAGHVATVQPRCPLLLVGIPESSRREAGLASERRQSNSTSFDQSTVKLSKPI